MPPTRIARPFIANRYSGFQTRLILRRLGLEQSPHVWVSVSFAQPSLHTVVQPVFVPSEFLGHLRRQSLDKILVPFKYRINITGIDLSVQGEQEGLPAIDHDLDRAPGCERSPAKVSQRELQC